MQILKIISSFYSSEPILFIDHVYEGKRILINASIVLKYSMPLVELTSG